MIDRYGPWAIVTGASDGIGRAIATELARAGLDLVLVARRESELAALAGELMRAHGRTCRVIALDLGVAGTTEELEARTSGLDVGLVVAAAGFGTSGELLGIPLASELAMVDVNCRAIVELVHAFGPRLARRGRGGLVLLSSLVAFQGVPRASAYAATKAFVQTYAEGIRHELGAHGVNVLAVAPGPVQSGFAARAGMTMGLAATPDDVARGVRRALRRGTRGTLRPGWIAKFLEVSLALLPRAGRVLVMRRVMGGMTRRSLPRPAPELRPEPHAPSHS